MVPLYKVDFLKFPFTKVINLLQTINLIHMFLIFNLENAFKLDHIYKIYIKLNT